jgi:hypothetical protein
MRGLVYSGSEGVGIRSRMLIRSRQHVDIKRVGRKFARLLGLGGWLEGIGRVRGPRRLGAFQVEPWRRKVEIQRMTTFRDLSIVLPSGIRKCAKAGERHCCCFH